MSKQELDLIQFAAKPTKPERGKSCKHIDGISATVTTLSRAICAEDKTITHMGGFHE